MMTSEGVLHLYSASDKVHHTFMSKDHLFTRSEICARVGLSDDVLAYWIVQGLIVPIASDTGRGKPKHFRFHQLNLAALLIELRGFGANIDSLRGLAYKLNEAFASAETLSSDYNVLAAIQEYWNARLDVVDGMIEGHWRDIGYARRPWEDVRKFYLQEGDWGVSIPVSIADTVEALDWDATAPKVSTYMNLAQVPDRRLSEDAQGVVWHFWRNSDASWETGVDRPRGVFSSIAIDIDRMLERVWLPSMECAA